MNTLPVEKLEAGSNQPVILAPEALAEQLAFEVDEIAMDTMDLALAADCFEAVASDEDAKTATDLVVQLTDVVRLRIEGRRVEAKGPYLEGTRVVDSAFRDLTTQFNMRVERLKQMLTAHQRAKAEADRLERERRRQEELEAARAAEAERLRAAQAAQAAEQEAAAARARAREAEDAEARAKAQEEIREAEARGEAERETAEQAGTAAASAASAAESLARATSTTRTQGTDADVGLTKFWTHAITDADALLESLGPLGPYIAHDHITLAINRAVKEGARGEDLPGVRIFQDSRANVRRTR